MPEPTDLDRMHIMLPRSMKHDLETIAENDDRPVSRLIREALGAYVRARKARGGKRA